MTACVVTGNTDSANGGGIANIGAIALDASSVTDNTAGNDGGGIFYFGTVELQNDSSVSGNTARENPNNCAGNGYSGSAVYREREP